MRPVRRSRRHGARYARADPGGLIIGQDTAALFYPFYLGIAWAWGCAGAASYLLVSAVSSLLSFALVIAMTGCWRAQLARGRRALARLAAAAGLRAVVADQADGRFDGGRKPGRAESQFSGHDKYAAAHTAACGSSAWPVCCARASCAPSSRRWCARCAARGRLLLEMIGDLLDVAKIESGTLTMQPVGVRPACAAGYGAYPVASSGAR